MRVGVRDTRGQMLIVVLWVIGIVAMAIGALSARANHELRLAQFPLAAVQRQAIAQAAIQQAISVLQHDEPAVDHLKEAWAARLEETEGPQPLEAVVVGDGAFSIGTRDAVTGDLVIGLIDEERKLNLNQADADAMTRLIASVDADVDAAQVAQAIIDWRDEGINTPWCDEVPLGYPCHNAPMDSLDELRLVPGMTPSLFEALTPYATIYGSGTVNANTADALVLSALGYDGAELVAQREAQPFDADHAPPEGLGVASTVFTVPVEASLAQASQVTLLQAVIDRAGCAADAPAGSRCVLAWSFR